MRPGIHCVPAVPDPSAGGVLSERSGLLNWLIEFATKPRRVHELIRYTGASGVALVLDTSVFFALVSSTALPAPFAAAIGYLSGALLHYLLSVLYIFAAEKTGKSHRRMASEFMVTGLLGLLLTVIVIRLTVDGMGVPPLIGKALSTGIAFLAVYVVRAGVVLAVPNDTKRAGELNPSHSISR